VKAKIAMNEIQGSSGDVVKRASDPDDGKVHVRASGAPIDPALCGRRGQTTISSASGWWGPDGKGWPDVCRECHRIERGLSKVRP